VDIGTGFCDKSSHQWENPDQKIKRGHWEEVTQSAYPMATITYSGKDFPVIVGTKGPALSFYSVKRRRLCFSSYAF